jgi:hypothetical protein
MSHGSDMFLIASEDEKGSNRRFDVRLRYADTSLACTTLQSFVKSDGCFEVAAVGVDAQAVLKNLHGGSIPDIPTLNNQCSYPGNTAARHAPLEAGMLHEWKGEIASANTFARAERSCTRRRPD